MYIFKYFLHKTLRPSNKRGLYIVTTVFQLRRQGEQSISSQKSVRKFEKKTRKKKKEGDCTSIPKDTILGLDGTWNRISKVFTDVEYVLELRPWIYKKHLNIWKHLFVYFVYLSDFIYLFCTFKEKTQGRSINQQEISYLKKNLSKHWRKGP